MPSQSCKTKWLGILYCTRQTLVTKLSWVGRFTPPPPPTLQKRKLFPEELDFRLYQGWLNSHPPPPTPQKKSKLLMDNFNFPRWKLFMDNLNFRFWDSPLEMKMKSINLHQTFFVDKISHCDSILNLTLRMPCFAEMVFLPKILVLDVAMKAFLMNPISIQYFSMNINVHTREFPILYANRSYKIPLCPTVNYCTSSLSKFGNKLWIFKFIMSWRKIVRGY